MFNYPASFEAAVSHAMLYEVGSHWNLNTPGVQEGLILTKEQRKNVGYVNDPLDKGGETKFGVAKNANPDLDITSLTWDGAKRTYFKRYWLAADCQFITEISPRLAVLHFDGAVNHGVGRAGRFLQRAVGAVEDGDVGPNTMKALASTLSLITDIDVCNKICNSREAFYEAIIQKNPSQARFRNGWLRRIREMRAFTTDPKISFN